VLSASDTAFYYSVYDDVQSATIYRTLRLLPGDPWPVGRCSRTRRSSRRADRRPTAISSDEQTLFFWDEVVAMERAAWVWVRTHQPRSAGLSSLGYDPPRDRAPTAKAVRLAAKPV
jgi:hypothetical protein